ncbi:hypothetical protein ILYODFUR_023549 [Ilyodon furcidens]|uniref:Uncharacterized protein n=1 Tax=Ilyodon furcidens TaxID=33524 RepID=A0ABV0TYX9_9TELE
MLIECCLNCTDGSLVFFKPLFGTFTHLSFIKKDKREKRKTTCIIHMKRHLSTFLKLFNHFPSKIKKSVAFINQQDKKSKKPTASQLTNKQGVLISCSLNTTFCFPCLGIAVLASPDGNKVCCAVMFSFCIYKNAQTK